MDYLVIILPYYLKRKCKIERDLTQLVAKNEFKKDTHLVKRNMLSIRLKDNVVTVHFLLYI